MEIIYLPVAIGVMTWMLCQLPDEFARRIKANEPTRGWLLAVVLVLSMFAVALTATVPDNKRIGVLEKQVKELQDANANTNTAKEEANVRQ